MKNNILIFISFLLVPFLSCKKEYKDLTTLEVKVYNKLTGALIQDTLRFRTMDNQTVDEWLFDEMHQIVVDEKFLPGSNYTFGFYASKDTRKVEHSYSINVDGNYNQKKYYGLSDGAAININEANLITLELYPYTFVKLKFKNMDCSVPTFFSFTAYHLEEPNFFNEGFTSFDGCTDFIQSDYSAWPMGNIHFEWHVTRNSITEIFHDTVYFDAGDSVIYEINY